MKNNKNLHGFTLMELLVVLVLLSLLVSIGLLVIHITRTNFQNFEHSNTTLQELQESDRKLTGFFFSSDTLYFDQHKRQLKTEKDACFELSNNQLLDCSNEIVLFDSITNIKLNGFRCEKDNQLIIDHLFFICHFSSQELPFSFSKQYDVATLLHCHTRDSIEIK